MHRKSRPFLLSLLAATLLAGAAWAVTEAELEAAASSLLVEYQDLHERFVEDVEPHATLKADFEALEVQRGDLHADRATLPPSCGCGNLDALIAAIDDVSDDIVAIIGNWPES